MSKLSEPDKITREEGSMQRLYYWIIATLNKPNGQTSKYLTFGGSSEDEARQTGFDMLGGQDFNIISLRTRDQATATGMWKRKLLESGHNLGDAVERVSHKKRTRHNNFTS